MLKNKIIFDTDIGSDIDDAYALVFALNSPEIEIKAILTNNSNVEIKAQIARAFTEKIPIFKGIENDKGVLTTKIGVKDYMPLSLEENLNLFKEEDLTYVSVGALSNLAFFLKHGIKFKKVIIMGGSLRFDYMGRKKRVKEWNLSCDVDATREVFNSDLNILLVPLDVTWDLELNEENIKMIERDNKKTSVLLTRHLNEMREYIYKKFKIASKKPVLHDPLAVYASFDNKLFSSTRLNVAIDDEGFLNITNNGKNLGVINKIEKEKFINLFMERILK